MSNSVLVSGTNEKAYRTAAIDLNTYYSGVVVAEAPTNGPGTGWYLIISGGAAGTGVQIAIELFTSVVYHRYCAAGTWASWTFALRFNLSGSSLYIYGRTS